MKITTKVVEQKLIIAAKPEIYSDLRCVRPIEGVLLHTPQSPVYIYISNSDIDC